MSVEARVPQALLKAGIWLSVTKLVPAMALLPQGQGHVAGGVLGTLVGTKGLKPGLGQ